MRAYIIKSRFFQLYYIALQKACGYGVSDIRPGLMVVGAVKSSRLAVEYNAVVYGKNIIPYSYFGIIEVNALVVYKQRSFKRIKRRAFGAPKARAAYLKLSFNILAAARVQAAVKLTLSHPLPVGRNNGNNGTVIFHFRVFVFYMRPYMNGGTAFGNVCIPNKNSAAANLICKNRVGYV